MPSHQTNVSPSEREIQTIGFKAPEVVNEHTYDTSIDIWSLGMVFIHLLANREFFIFMNRLITE